MNKKIEQSRVNKLKKLYLEYNELKEQRLKDILKEIEDIISNEDILLTLSLDDIREAFILLIDSKKNNINDKEIV